MVRPPLLAPSRRDRRREASAQDSRRAMGARLEPEPHDGPPVARGHSTFLKGRGGRSPTAQRMLKAGFASPDRMTLSDGVRLGHINVEVADLKRARRFYDRFLSVLGFPRIPPDDPHWLGYRKGRTTIWVTVSRPQRVVRRSPRVPTDGVKDPISDHIAFAAPSATRVGQIEAALRHQGFRPVYPTSRQGSPGGWYISNAWKDPDNNVLEIYAVTRRKALTKPSRSSTRTEREGSPSVDTRPAGSR